MLRAHTNRTLIRIVGMSRSGNHAIINWITAQLPGRWCFLNCVEPKTNPFHSARPLDDGRCFLTNDAGFDLQAHQAGELSAKDHLLFSHEDTFLGPALGRAATAAQEAWIGSSQRRIDVVVLRDPYNLFASRQRFGHQFVTELTTARIWKQHARAFLNEGRGLAGPVLGLSYNSWVLDSSYREEIAGALGLAFTDDWHGRIARCGGGSSFDGYDYDGEARRMNVFERWRHYRDNPSFHRLLDPEVRALASRIFGPPPAGLSTPRSALSALNTELSASEG